MRHPVYRGLLLCVIALSSAALTVRSGLAQQQSVNPGINRSYAHPDFARWQTAFEHSGREVYDRRNDIVAATGARPGMVVADIGAGTGLFTRLFASRVAPSGRVLAVDVSPVFVANILRIAHEQGLSNVEGIVNTQTDVALAPESVDLAFVCDTYHHFEYPRRMMESIHRALRRDGMLVLIDFRRIPGVSSPWALSHVRAGKRTFVAEIEASGFKLVEELSFLRDSYFLRFRKV